MKLTNKNVEYLLSVGYLKEDIPYINRALDNEHIDCLVNVGSKEHKITYQTAKSYLGTNEFISGIARATFHGSAFRYNGKKEIIFCNKR